MPSKALTGTRIRDRRLVQGMKQAELADIVGISPSYINLIEHNRRRIGGKLLADIARALGRDVAELSEGAEAALIMGLRAAASATQGGRIPTGRNPAPEADRIEEFCGRFPGWAASLDAGYRRIERLERTVATLTDRLTHDPYLSASLHEVLSRVTAIRSTSAILAGGEEIDANWQARFQKNLHEDAQRLSESSQALVSYLDRAGDAERNLTSPQEELDGYLAQNGYHIAALEQGADIQALVEAEPRFSSHASRDLAAHYLKSYVADAQALPLAAFQQGAQDQGFDPGRLARAFDVPIPQILRRLATLPADATRGGIGRIACDGAGALVFRKPLAGFMVPRFGSACPLWPLFQALRAPHTPIAARVAQGGREPRHLMSFAYADTAYPDGFGGPMLVRAEMILIPPELLKDPTTRAAPTHEPAQDIGSTCRICSRASCVARREPSILSDEE